MRSVVFWRVFAVLIIVLGVVSLFSPPTSFQRADVPEVLKLVWSVLMITGGLGMLTPSIVIELSALMLPIAAHVGWALILISLNGSWSSVIFSVMLVGLYVSRVMELGRALKTRR